MSRKSKTKQWFKQHQKDPFVQMAQKQGLRSRASFKLTEIQNKYRFIQPNDTLIDLGAAPGSWSGTCATIIKQGQIIACDLLPMDPIAGVNFIQGDFTQSEVQEQMLNLSSGPIQVIISDMSPNHTGIKKVDQWRAHGLNESVLFFCQQHLQPGGHCLLKVFHSGDFSTLIKQMRQCFSKVHIIKPQASRNKSSEVFVLGMSHDPKS